MGEYISDTDPGAAAATAMEPRVRIAAETEREEGGGGSRILSRWSPERRVLR